MKIYEVKREERAALLPALLEVWESSVRATHDFLSDAQIEEIKTYVPEALMNVPHLVAAEDETGLIGFFGTAGEKLEMLFLSPSARGKGLGRRLLERSIQEYGVRETTVNEQNPQAVGFYRHMGFVPYKRTESDEEGNPFPLLYLRLEENSQM